MSKKIFIQIASYRDPELVPTIKHLLEKAKHPEQLTFGICNQFSMDDDWENLDQYRKDDRFRIIDVDFRHSKGACWARHLTQLLHKDEHFTMQIDSHCRFVQDWDELVVDMWESLHDDKAILTCYPPNYNPGLPENQWYHTPQICNLYKFDHRYTVSRPMDMPEWKNRTSPRRGIFIAAGFIFGLGRIIKDVPYDPEFYFSGEEIALALRFFTNGYNIYHPHKLILHHFYSRPENKKHWGDHTNWGSYNKVATERLDALLGHNDIQLGSYGLGSIRTIDDYKNYAGVDYKNFLVHEYTEKGGEPPHEYDEDGWNNIKVQYSNVLRWDSSQVDTAEDVTFWAFIVMDQYDIAIHRWDALTEDNQDIIINRNINERTFQFEHNPKKQIPTNLLVWPYSKSKGWLEKSNFKISN